MAPFTGKGIQLNSEELKQTLETKQRDELNVIARKLDLSKFRRNTKQELIERILKEKKITQVVKVLQVSRWDRIYFHLFGWSSFISLLITIVPVLLVGGAYLFKKHNEDRPPVAVSTTTATTGPHNESQISPTPSPSAAQANSQVAELSQRKNQSSLYTRRAQILYNQGKYPEAIIWCDKALILNPQNTRATALKARIQRTKTILNPSL